MSNHIVIYLSHIASDAPFAKRLESDLIAQGYGVRSNAAVADEAAIFHAIDECDIYLIVLSPDALRASEIARELNYAGTHGKAIIPLVAVPCVIPIGMAQRQVLMFTEDYEGAFLDLKKAIERQIRSGIPPRIGIPLLVVLLLVATIVFGIQQRIIFWGIMLGTASFAAIAKTLAAWIGDKVGRIARHIFIFLGQCVSVSMLLLAGFLTWHSSTPYPDGPAALGLGAFAGFGAGLVLMLELVLTGIYRSSVVSRGIQRFVEFLDYFTQMAKVFGIFVESLLWLLGGAIAGIVGVWLAQRLI